MNKVIARREVNTHDIQLPEHLHPVLKRVYAARGIRGGADLERELKDLVPFSQLKGMTQAVARLYQALVAQQRITIIGDFDADGATSTAIAINVLRALGAQHVHFIVPNRFTYGYGLTPAIVDLAQLEQQPDLIITVDNGISSLEGVASANALNIDVIITDHHLPGDGLPDACAIVNPNQPGCEFPSKNLAGCGVIFYVMLALRRHCVEQQWFEQQGLTQPNMSKWLDLVALGTVADVVPLDRNNRILVHQGLRRIRAGRGCPGIQALLTIAKRDAAQLVSSDLGFAVGPRLNAAGRIDDMHIGIQCLLSEDSAHARQLAEKLDSLNRERREIESDMKTQAMNALSHLSIDNNALPLGLCLFEEDWHQGVIGIVAGRIKERFHRPTICFAKADNGEIKGSARSIQGLHMRDCLDLISKKHPDLILKFGGHAMAAGLSILQKDFETFKTAYIKALKILLNSDCLDNTILTDGELGTDDFNLTLAEHLREAGPWGQAFPEPLFQGEFNILDQRIVGQNHLKLKLSIPHNGQQLDAIYFNVDEKAWPNHRAEKLKAAYKLDVNEFRGSRTVQIMIEYAEVV